ncbi:MAG: S-layer protein [Methanoregula sp.]|jgi:hypothetical protein|nr:S-layer protein [Methanoregula sp.]
MAQKAYSGPAGTAIIILTLLVCSALIVAPVCAATQYLGGAPSFSAEVGGVNEFLPGEDATISILVKNSGINRVKQVDRGTIEPEDLPNTAKFVTIGLASDNGAIIIKTDPQMVGDITGSGNAVTVQFKAKISSNATVGEYQLPLTIQYKYPRVIDQEKADVFEFTYNDEEVTLPVTIRIKPQVKVEVLEAVPDRIAVGSEGYINLKIKNTGMENGQNAVVKLLRNGNSPIVPTDSTVFIGDFPSGGTVECRYKVSVSQDATSQSYPVDVAVSYTNREGSIVTSSSETVGIPVNAKPVFTIISPVAEVPRGTSSTIDIQYRNDGSVTVYSAQVRITPHDPVTIADNMGFLGDIEPGETVVASYEVAVDSDADPVVYTFDSNIRYRDTLGTSHESDTIPVQVAVISADSGSLTMPVIAGCIIAIILICAAFLLYRKRQESR